MPRAVLAAAALALACAPPWAASAAAQSGDALDVRTNASRNGTLLGVLPGASQESCAAACAADTACFAWNYAPAQRLCSLQSDVGGLLLSRGGVTGLSPHAVERTGYYGQNYWARADIAAPPPRPVLPARRAEAPRARVAPVRESTASTLRGSPPTSRVRAVPPAATPVRAAPTPRPVVRSMQSPAPAPVRTVTRPMPAPATRTAPVPSPRPNPVRRVDSATSSTSRPAAPQRSAPAASRPIRTPPVLARAPVRRPAAPASAPADAATRSPSPAPRITVTPASAAPAPSSAAAPARTSTPRPSGFYPDREGGPISFGAAGSGAAVQRATGPGAFYGGRVDAGASPPQRPRGVLLGGPPGLADEDAAELRASRASGDGDSGEDDGEAEAEAMRGDGSTLSRTLDGE